MLSSLPALVVGGGAFEKVGSWMGGGEGEA